MFNRQLERDMRLTCPMCHGSFECATGRYNRAQAIGAPLYCCKTCAGLARRTPRPTEQERRASKAAYDRERRQRLGERLRAEKRAHYQANRARILADMTRKRPAKMAAHIEYCRRPEYRAYKSEYDKRRLARKQFGEFADAALTLRSLETEIDAKASRYEVYMQNRTINKAQTRRRAL